MERRKKERRNKERRLKKKKGKVKDDRFARKSMVAYAR